MKKTVFPVIIIFLIIAGSCIKTTVNFDKFSDDIGLSPSYVISAVKGEVTLLDLIEPNDTLVVDPDNALKLVIREDSVINYEVSDFYDSFSASSFSKTLQLVAIGSLDDIRDTIDIDPGDDIKLKEMNVSTGSVNYTVTSWCSFDVQVDILFPSIDDEGTPLTATITVGPNSISPGTIDLASTIINLDTDPLNSCNRLPLEYDLITGTGIFDPADSVRVEVTFEEPEFDYARGYFGMHQVESDRDTLDTDMDDLFSKITGEFYLTNPIIRVNYKNSFGLPMRIEAQATGKNSTEEISLDRDPVDLDHPTSPDNREVISSFEINRDNSSLPELVSMLPNEIIFYGSASVNPDGETAQDNYIFGDSRFEADIEVEVPFEFRIIDLQLADTIDNFFLSDDPEEGSPLDMLIEGRLDMYIENGFPLGGDITIQLYDSLNATILESIGTDDLFAPADVDANGRVIEPVIHNSSIELTEDFLAAAESADKMILIFTLYTTDHGTKDVKIYSDYGIVFKAGLYFKADFNLK